MRKFRKTVLALSLSALAALVAGAVTGCGKGAEEDVADGIINGSFEYDIDQKTIPGWTREGMAFQSIGVTNENAEDMEAHGRMYFNGQKAIITNKGTLTSETFKLSGTGKIAFKLGAAKNPEKVYIEFYDAQTDKPLAFLYDGASVAVKKATNTEFDGAFVTGQLIRHIADLSEHIGKNVYIVITDDDASRSEAAYGYANLDDFRLLETEEEVQKYQAERSAQLIKYAAPPFDDSDPTRNDILNGDFESGLDHWKMTGEAFRPNGIRDKNATYWGGRYFYNHGEKFFCGESNEGAIGSMRSTTFTLKEGAPWISMMLGAAKNSSEVYAEVCLAEDVGEESKGTVIKKIANKAFLDPDSALMLIRTYAKIDAKYEGKKMYINVVDNATGGFGFINIDDIRCSLTDEEVSALIREQYEAAMSETRVPAGQYSGDLQWLRNYYVTCDYHSAPSPFVKIVKEAENRILEVPAQPVNLNELLFEKAQALYLGREVPLVITNILKNGVQVPIGNVENFTLSEGVYTVTYVANAPESINQSAEATVSIVVNSDKYNIVNGGFELGNLTGWELVELSGMTESVFKAKAVDNHSTYWGEKLPFNKSGSYFLGGNEGGVSEGATYKLRSTVFELGGSGWISVKMGGHAKFYVYEVGEDGADSLVGAFLTTRFADGPNMTLAKDDAGNWTGSWLDMAPYALDLSNYKGQDYRGKKLYIELEDYAESGWGIATFDDVITYYESAPDLTQTETVNNRTTNGVVIGTIDIGWVNLSEGSQQAGILVRQALPPEKRKK